MFMLGKFLLLRYKKHGKEGRVEIKYRLDKSQKIKNINICAWKGHTRGLKRWY
jgi:hypothetical protein